MTRTVTLRDSNDDGDGSGKYNTYELYCPVGQKSRITFTNFFE